MFFFEARDIKVVRPIYGVELFDGETARFEVEISEDDVHGQWKLNGDVLSPSSVSTSSVVQDMSFILIMLSCEQTQALLSSKWMTLYNVIWQDVDIIEEGGKHTLILYNCKVSMTGEVAYAAANAKCSANLKVKGKPTSFIHKKTFRNKPVQSHSSLQYINMLIYDLYMIWFMEL